ncbi:Protein hu-li tai shao [Lucilia cuprina]|nr:Protein hu-li tai shao [Lucilia cuprina]
MTEVEQPPQNGIDLSAAEDEESSKARPADIEQDMREMERRKRVEAIMGSKLFREELERIVDCARDSGNAAGILQQLSDIVGVPSSRVGSVFKTSTCMLPINDIRGVESMGYAKGEKILRCKLAATFRLLDLYGWTQGLGAQITARLKVDQEYFLVNPFGLLYHEITASSLNKVDMQGNIVEQGTTNFGVNKSHFVLHSAVHAARPDIRCAIYIGCSPVVAISSLKTGLLPLTKDACVLGELTTYSYTGYLHDEEERNKLVRNLGPNSKVMLLTNHGALCCGETIEEAFFAACHIVQACETQLKLLPVGLDNLVLIPEESRKIIYDQSRRPPEDLEKKFAAATITDSNKSEEEKKEGVETTTKVIGQAPKWRVGGAEFEALMRMLDNAGYRTGYIYRHPLIKSDPPKPKNDVELPPAVSSLGYLLEEEELFRQGIWKKGDLRKGGDRSRWLNSPNVYQKVEVLETGTPDPKKITKWVAEGSPTHSTPVRIDDPLQFVPVNTNPKEFKRVQQQIKDNRRADKISAGPQSHILEGVTWDEANRIKDATVSSAGDHVVLMGAASKGIIQRGFQHNATVYKAPYAKNPFDNVTDDELNEYKRTVERKKKSIHDTDTDFSESEALSSLQTSGAQQQTKQTTTTTTTTTAAVSQSEPEDISEHHVMRIQTEQAPVPSQPEVVLSDASLSFINGERSHTATNRKPPTGRDIQYFMKPYQTPQYSNIHESLHLTCNSPSINHYQTAIEDEEAGKEEDAKSFSNHYQEISLKLQNNQNSKLLNALNNDLFFQNQKDIVNTYTPTYTLTQSHSHKDKGNGNLNLANMSIYDSPHQYISRAVDKFGDTSFYTSCGIKSDGYSTTNDKYLELIEKHFQICCTPKICDKIFESVLKSKSISNEFVLKSDHNLTADVPHNNCDVSYRGRTATIPCSKLKSPFRTVSHFGYNSPMREPKPDHKHLLFNPEYVQKYVPLRRSVSYEEIFSSPRYLNLCEYCFELVVRLKPELMKYKTKLHNLTKHKSSFLKSVSGQNDLARITANTVSHDLSEKESYITDLNESFSVFSFQKDSVGEEEDEIGSKRNVDDLLSATTNSSFKEKIAPRMMYSELQSNTVNSQFSLREFEAYDINTSQDECVDYDLNNNGVNSNNSNYMDNLTNHIKIKDNWECFENTVKIHKFLGNSQKLMSREERSRRKLEFQELWEDHVSFAENRENIIDSMPKIILNIKNDVSQVSKVTKSPETTLNDSENGLHFANNDIDNADKFSPLERTILEKINTNDLCKSEEIFGKIENTIRNKLNPSMLELMIKEQATLHLQKNENKIEKLNSPKSKSLMRSCSFTPLRFNSSTPKCKLNKTTVVNNMPASLIKNSNMTKHKNRKCRNFILENIRSVSVPRQIPPIKRLQSNFDTKIGKGILPHEQNTSYIHSPKKRKSGSSAVYTFQSKLVNGSPRFWISMPQISTKVSLTPSTSGIKTSPATPKDKHSNSINSTLAVTRINNGVSTNVDAEINALGEEIQQIQPRLEKYKRKLDDFGSRVTECVNNINECVTTQEDINNVRQKFKDCIELHQYTEEIVCHSTQSNKTLTLSISLPKYYKICEHFDKLKEKNLSKKYSFLYNQSWWSPYTLKGSQILLYMIHKIEIYPHYTYPIIPHGVVGPSAGNEVQNIINGLNVMMIREDDQIIDDKTKLDATNLLPPYRTVSHYGFNYPSTYIPNISMHPVCSITPVNLQRQKVIAFIKRLNLEANTHEQQLSYSNKTAGSINVENDTKTGKEANIYENTKSCEDKTDVAGSFISVAEIQLNTAKEKNRSKEITNHQHTHSRFRNRSNHHINQGDLQSNQFPSLLSISGTYPAATHSHIGDAENDHFTTDSGDNSSNFELQSTRKTTHDNLYRTYLQRNFIPEVINSHQSIMDFDIGDDEHDPHKPESEQRSHNNIKDSSKYIRNDDNKHVTLTLNSLKRRASSFRDKNDKTKTHDKPLLARTSFKKQLSDANSSCDSSTASTAIEIHINVNIRNSDCVKNLQNHEQEFKTKLEKVIDDEINLITQELATSSQCEKEMKNITAFHLNPSHRCLSAPESVFLYGRDQSCIEADRHSLFNLNESVVTTPLHPPSALSSNLYTMRYRQTLAMLEHELEILLNSIIRNMCDCKTKISQISEDIRTATLHVGENVQNGDHSEAHLSTFSHSSKEDISTDGSPKKDKKKKKGLRTPSFLKKKKEKKKAEA